MVQNKSHAILLDKILHQLRLVVYHICKVLLHPRLWFFTAAGQVALKWDKAFQGRADASGRAVAGVHVQAMDGMVNKSLENRLGIYPIKVPILNMTGNDYDVTLK